MTGAGFAIAVPTTSRVETRTPSPRTLWVIGLVGLAATAGSVTLALTSEYVQNPAFQGFIIGWISVPYILSGLIAWRRRPNSRFGMLMVAAGFVTLGSTLQWSGNSLLYTLGQLLDLPMGALFLHVILAFPSGRLSPWPDRAIAVTGYVAAIGLSAVVLMLGGFDPRNVLTISAQPGVAETVQNVQLLTLSAATLTGFVVLVVRRWRTGRARVRAVELLIDAFALVLVMLSALYVAGTFALPGFQPLQLAALGAVGLAPIAFMLGVLDARLARSGLGDLLLQLRADTTPDLRGPIARALRDPSVEIAYWLPQYGSWADHEGQPVPFPARRNDRAASFIERRGQLVAALIHDPSLADEPELLDAVKAAAGIALENGQLQADLRARMQELQGSRLRVIEAGQQERQRLERDLHDGAQQRLVSLALELGLLEDSVTADPVTRERLTRAREEVALSLTELRDIARGIYPAVLAGHGLAVAVESLAARATVPVQLELDLEQRMPEPVEVAAYYVVCESLANVGKHAQATSASVRVCRERGMLVVEIVDDGIGEADTDKGSGLRGLADRVEALGGQLRIWTPTGGGTRVRAEIPCR